MADRQRHPGVSAMKAKAKKPRAKPRRLGALQEIAPYLDKHPLPKLPRAPQLSVSRLLLPENKF